MDGETDGRRLRGAENRRRIVEAVLALVSEGHVAPSAEQVASRAEVGLRTVFRHFDDMEGLYREISERITAELAPLVLAPLPGDDEARLEATIERRAQAFERMMPFRVAAEVHRHTSPFLAEDQAKVRATERKMLRSALRGTRYEERLRADDGLRFEALDLVMGFDAWRRLRLVQGLSVARAKRATALAVAAILGE
ncbi:MAG: TetR/AcrR family transcriptional regulator [Polyangiales bacterium]